MMNETTPRTRAPGRRRPLTRESVLQAALRLADQGGIEAVSMRRLGQALRVEAMSLYRHVAGKEDVLDGLAELVAAEFEAPSPGVEWRAAIRRSAISVHDAVLRHPWAAPVLESRTNPGPDRLRYLDAFIGVLAAAGFSLPAVTWAFAAIDGHTYGFAMQERAMPFGADRAGDAASQFVARQSLGAYPSLDGLARAVAEHPETFPLRFEFGLDLLLDGLERMLAPGAGQAPRPSASP
jgi:AcrR family transcriptional regulator